MLNESRMVCIDYSLALARFTSKQTINRLDFQASKTINEMGHKLARKCRKPSGCVEKLKTNWVKLKIY